MTCINHAFCQVKLYSCVNHYTAVLFPSQEFSFVGNVFGALIFDENIRIYFNKFDYFCQKEQFSVYIAYNLSEGLIAWDFSVLGSSSRSALAGWGVRAAVARGIFGTSSGFRVGWRTAGRVELLFFKSFLLVLAKLSFWRGGLGAGLAFYGD